MMNRFQKLPEKQSLSQSEAVKIRVGMRPAPPISLLMPRVAVVYNFEEWAFSRIARRTCDFLNAFGYQARMFTMIEVPPFQDIDAILLIWWGAVVDWLFQIPLHIHVFTCVFDCFSHRGGRGLAFLRLIAFRSTAIFVSTQDLGRELISRAIIRHAFLFSDSVDSDFFRYVPLSRKDPSDLVIGWAGNSRLGGGLKGLWIVEAACKQVGLKLQIAEKYSNFVPYEKMPEFYAGIDVLAIASSSEGGPNTALEAASVGRVLLSTHVGLVPQLLGASSGGIIVSRSVDDFIDGLKELQNKVDILPEWGAKNREEVEQRWQWGTQVKSLEYVLCGYLKEGGK